MQVAVHALDTDRFARQLLALMEPAVVLPADAPARVIAIDQSNTSVVFGEQVIAVSYTHLTLPTNREV